MKPTIGRNVLYMNESGLVYPAIVAKVHEIVEPTHVVVELTLCVFDAILGPRMYTTASEVASGAPHDKGQWAWPPIMNARQTIDLTLLKALIDAAIDERLDRVDPPAPSPETPASSMDKLVHDGTDEREPRK